VRVVQDLKGSAAHQGFQGPLNKEPGPDRERSPRARRSKLSQPVIPPGKVEQTIKTDESNASYTGSEVPRKLLAIDVGGSKFKILATGQTEPRKMPSGKKLTPAKLVEAVTELANDWEYEAISIGYPGLVGTNGPRSEPGNLGPGWVGFDFGAAFGKPVRVINDAAMQALGSYEGGRMLFLGLGTGLGSALIANGVIVPLELGQLPHTENQTLGAYLGRENLKVIGKKVWREAVMRIIPVFMGAFVVEDLVIGGGNSKLLKDLPAGARIGHNLTAFRGGFRLWQLDDVPTLNGEHAAKTGELAKYRLI
jgi:polyphosphate glucokinase